jgi:hypothetical protein
MSGQGGGDRSDAYIGDHLDSECGAQNGARIRSGQFERQQSERHDLREEEVPVGLRSENGKHEIELRGMPRSERAIMRKKVLRSRRVALAAVRSDATTVILKPTEGVEWKMILSRGSQFCYTPPD